MYVVVWEGWWWWIIAGGDASVVMLFGIQVSMFVRMYFIHTSSSP